MFSGAEFDEIDISSIVDVGGLTPIEGSRSSLEDDAFRS